MNTLLILIIYGISLGMLYFLLSSGLSLIFGLMKVLNFAHGSLFMWGAYIGYTVFKYTNSFILGILIATIVVGIMGLLMERFLIKPLGNNHMYQLLLTFGLINVLNEIVKIIWGAKVIPASKPQWLSDSVHIFGNVLPTYRIFIMIAGVMVLIMISLILSKTKLGMIIRAGIERPNMVRALGIDVSKIFTIVFIIGAMLAGLGGAIAGPFLSLYPELGVDQIFYALVIVVIGGLGSFIGSAVGGLVVGLTQSIVGYYYPALSMLITILLMLVILIVKPEGLVSLRRRGRE